MYYSFLFNLVLVIFSFYGEMNLHQTVNFLYNLEQMKSTKLSESTRDGSQNLRDTVGSTLRETQRTLGFQTSTKKDPLRVEKIKQKLDSVLVRVFIE